jgi:hypothetical protein
MAYGVAGLFPYQYDGVPVDSPPVDGARSVSRSPRVTRFCHPCSVSSPVTSHPLSTPPVICLVARALSVSLQCGGVGLLTVCVGGLCGCQLPVAADGGVAAQAPAVALVHLELRQRHVLAG